MINLKNFAIDLIGRNPQFSNNKNAQEMLRVIQSNDVVRGEQIARNICQSYGITPEQAIQEAKRYFNFPF